jgi:ABC-2 type transport system permease protein
MNSLKGTGALLRLAIRRDRFKLALWLLALAGLVTAYAHTYSNLFKNQQELSEATLLFVNNPSVRIFALPSGIGIGEITLLKTFVTLAILLGLVSAFTVVRHTRQNEETGRLELLGSAQVGKHASLTAALLITVGANLVLMVLLTLGLMASRLPFLGSFAAAAAIVSIGIVFTGVAAVTSQLSQGARGANGLASVVVGAAAVLSGLGSLLGKLAPGGVVVIPAWQTWVTPIGWGEMVRPYYSNNLWLLFLPLAAFIVLTVTAYQLEARRDVGIGLLQARRGQARASFALLGTFGLPWRLQRGVFVSWSLGMVCFAVVFGSVANSFTDLLSSNDQINRILSGGHGPSTDVIGLFLGAMIGIFGFMVTAYTIPSLLRLHTEELGPGESILATSISRLKWALAHIIPTLVEAVVLLLACGLIMGVVADVTRHTNIYLWPLFKSSLMQLPAMLVLASFVVFLFGVSSRFVITLSWVAMIMAVLLGPMFGALLNLPQWVLDLSPFTHIPNALVGPVAILPLVVLSGIALLLSITGLIVFRMRNINTV